jgi:hypothetical protein
VANERRLFELQRVEDLTEMFDERLDRVLSGRGRLVGESVSLEVDRDCAKSRFRDDGQVVPK